MTRSATLLITCLTLAACGGGEPEPGPAQLATPPATDSTPPEVVPPAPTDPAPSDPTADSAASPAGTMTVRLYYTRDEEPVAVDREIPRGPGVLRATLEALLRGPTAAEREAGLFSWFSDDTAGMLRDVRLDGSGKAIVDFRDFSRTISGASSSAGSRILLNELNRTVFQFETVRSVEYRIEGSCDAFWNWIQTECTVVERP